MFDQIKEHLEEIEKAGDELRKFTRRGYGRNKKQDKEYEVAKNDLNQGEYVEKKKSLTQDKVKLHSLSEKIAFDKIITEEVRSGNFSKLSLLTSLNNTVLNALILSGPNNRKYQETIDNINYAKQNGKQGELEIFKKILDTQQKQGFYLEDRILDLRSISKLNHRQADKLSMILNIKEVRLDGLKTITPLLANSLSYFNVETINLSGINLDTIENGVIQEFLKSQNPALQLVFTNGKTINSKDFGELASIN